MPDQIKVKVTLKNSNYEDLGEFSFEGDTEVYLLLDLILAKHNVQAQHNMEQVYLEYANEGRFDGNVSHTLLRDRVQVCTHSGELTIILRDGVLVDQPQESPAAGYIQFFHCNTNKQITVKEQVSTYEFIQILWNLN